jgi:hypothetical protein
MSRTAWLASALVACSSPPAPSAPPAVTPRESPRAHRSVAPPDAAPPFAPTAEDCAAFRDAPVLAVAVVTAATSDCSSVGHRRVVLEVRNLARGAGVATVVASRPLHDRLRAGNVVIAAIDPVQRPAEKVFCVELPAHEGTLRRAIQLDDADADRTLADLASGSLCAR